jgi:hypothetical protein
VKTGSLSSLSARDLIAIKERREWEKQEADREHLAEDTIEYEKFVRVVEEDQKRVAPALRIKPIPLEEWRAYADPAINDPVVRGAAATNAALLSKIRTEEAIHLEAVRKAAREAVIAGKLDPGWNIPASAASLKMSIEDATTFVKAEADTFVKATPAYYPCKQNWERMRNYIDAQGIVIPNAEVFAQAYERLFELGLLEQRPAPAPEPISEPQVPQPDPEELRQQKRNDYLTKIVVTDPRTGEGLTEYQLDRLPSDEYKRLVLGEFRTPRITDVIKPGWHRDI